MIAADLLNDPTFRNLVLSNSSFQERMDYASACGFSIGKQYLRRLSRSIRTDIPLSELKKAIKDRTIKAVQETPEVINTNKELHPQQPTVTVEQNKVTIVNQCSLIHTEEEIRLECNLPVSDWYCPKIITKPYGFGSKDSDGNQQVTQMWSVHAIFERKVDVVAARQEIESLIEWGREEMPHFPAIVHEYAKRTHLLDLAIFDIHMGRVCYPPSTGGPPYDVNIAEKTVWTVVESLLHKASGYDIDRILFPVGNDLMHVDNLNNTTTGGTPMEADGRYHRTFKRTRELMCSIAERLREIAPVDICIIGGNHDFQSSYCIGDSMDMYFRNCDDVVVHNEPISRKAFVFGGVFIGMTHGNEERIPDLPTIFENEFPAYGASRTREIHIGHYHTDCERSFGTTKLRYIPAICPKDTWTAKKGLNGQRSSYALLYDRDSWQATISHTIIDERRQPVATY